MTNLNYPISGKTPEEIAKYFNFDAKKVMKAISSGCKTYQAVYDYVKSGKAD